MTSEIFPPFNPELDLKLDRFVDVPPELVYEAWTTPEHLKHWFCPKPWSVAECELDPRPGGIFRTVMRSPEGQEFPDEGGCFLEVVPNRQLVWTSALRPGYRPAADVDLPFTAILSLTPEGTGTRYTAIAMHRDPAGRKTHADMGFEQGWGTVLDQLVEYIKAGMAK
ncbi:MAG: SRPBCC family protein [Sumerlaeia bacterium]